MHTPLRLVSRLTCLFRRDAGGKGGEMTRATAFGNRTISGQKRDDHAGSDAESEQGDPTDGLEMAAMAKVWAHPEDLHKYPVSPDTVHPGDKEHSMRTILVSESTIRDPTPAALARRSC